MKTSKLKTNNHLKKYIEIKTNTHYYSKYKKGIHIIAKEIFELAEYNKMNNPITTNWKEFEKELLNGADNWYNYAYTGNPYAYNDDIAQILLTPSEYKKWNGKEYVPGHQKNQDLTFLDLQYIAVRRAVMVIKEAHRNLVHFQKN